MSNEDSVRIIYHLSDIHVKKYNNDDEYETVFKTVYNKIGRDTKNALIVIVGDVFDSIITPSSVMIVKNFLYNLSALCDVVIIRGNHDQVNKSNECSCDSLSSTVYKLKTKHKIFLYNVSGIYIYKNIVFGVTDIYDKSIYQIANNDEYKDKIKIALWHGDCASYDNIKAHSKITIKDFKSYDYVMLGHIHKFQHLDKNKTIAYSGSLIQQNYGESIDKHGFIKWNLEKGNSKFVEIPNDYGYITIRLENNVELKDTILPKNTRLRLIRKNCSTDFVKSILDKIKSKTNVIEYVEQVEYEDVKPDDEITSIVNNNVEIVNDKDATEQLMKYIDHTGKQDEDEKKELQKIITETIKDINYKYDTDKKNIKIKNLTFNNFNVFGKDNYIDYEKMHGVINICGRNHTGKSTATVYALLFAIFGKCQGDLGTKKKDVHGSEYINNSEKEMTTQIAINVNGHDYEIQRVCGFDGKKRETKHYYSTLKLTQDGIDISGKTQQNTNAIIENLVGTCNELLSQCIIDQKNPTGFLYMSDIEKKEYVCKIAKLDIYEQLQQKLESKHRYNSIAITEKNKRIYQDKKCNDDKTTIIGKELTELKMQKESIQKEIEEITKEFNDATHNKIKYELRLKETQIDGDETDEIDNIIVKKEECEGKIEKCVTEIEKLGNEIKENRDQIGDEEKIKQKNIKFENNKKKKSEQFRDKCNKLREEYVKIDKQIRDLVDIQKEQKDVVRDKKEIEKQKKELNLDDLKHVINVYEKDKSNDTKHEKYISICDKIENNEKKIKLIEENINGRSKQSDIDKYEEYQTKIKSNEKKIEKLEKKFDKKVMENENNEFEAQRAKDIKKLTNAKEGKMRMYEKIDYTLIGVKIDKLTKDKSKIIKDAIREKIKKLEGIQKNNDHSEYTTYKLTQTQSSENKKRLSLLEERVKEFRKQNEIIKDHKVNPKCKVCMSNNITIYKQQLDTIINETENEISKLQEEIAKCDDILRDIQKRDDFQNIQKFAEDIEEIDTNIQKMHNMVKQIDINLEIEEFIKKTNDKILEKQNEENETYVEYQKNIEIVKKLKDNNNEMYEEIKDVETMKERNDVDKKEISNLNISNDKLRNKLESLNEFIIFRKKYDDAKEMYEKNMIEHKHLIEKSKTNEVRKKMIDKEIDEYNKYEKTIIHNKEIKEKINDTEEKLRDTEMSKNEEYDEYLELIAKVGDDNETLMKLELVKSKLQTELNVITKQCDAYEEIMKKREEHIRLKKKYVSVLEKYDNSKQKQENKTKLREDIISRISGLETELNIINQLKDENKKLCKTNAIVEKIIHVIKNGYVDDILTKCVLPKLTNVVNTILSTYVTYRIKMEYKEKKLIVHKVDENGLLSNSLKMSGYEEDMANIGFRLGLNQISKITTTNFFIIDEGFKQCDWLNIKNVDGLFGRMRQIYDFIIVITHNDDIKSYTDIDIPIEKKDGYSYINMKEK